MTRRPDRIYIAYGLTFETPFHCGTGLRLGVIDRTVVRDHDDYLYVPGSTIKGIVREHCERLARMYSEQDQAMSKLIASPHSARNALFGLGHRMTMISRIFGSHNTPGRLFFEDAHQDEKEKKEYRKDGEGKYKNLQAELYTQVRLHRPTRTAVPGALYTSEFGIKNVTLHGEINGWLQCTPVEKIGKDAPTYSLLLLLTGLSLFDQVGGNKSTGKGKCRCDITTVKVGEQSYEKKTWQGWFDHLEALADYAVVGADLEEGR